MIGTDAYRFIPEEYGRPIVVSAFEPVDLLQSIAMLLRQRAEGRCEVENQYTRVVRPEGNARALAAIDETMELRDDFEWRGLGTLPRSALRLRPAFAAWDAEELYALPGARIEDPKACRCGEVLTDRSSRGSAASSAPPARRSGRSARAWSRARARARPSTPTAASGSPRRSRLARRRRRAAGRADHARARRRRQGDPRPRRGALPRGASTTTRSPRSATRPSSRARAGSRSRPTRYVVHPLEFPGRRHRRARGERHRQRPRDGRRAAALAHRRVRDRGGLPDRRPAADRRVDGRGRAGSRASRSSPATRRSSSVARRTGST